MATLSFDDQAQLREMLLLRKLVASQKVSDMGLCPSLLRHLNELEVMTRKLHEAVIDMQAIVEKKLPKV